ncbi:MAG: dihydrolipoamide acetyltransferase family protein, partial [Microcystaceae cyanobacterium]
MIHDIFMPALSSTMTEGKIVSWLKSPGDKVAKGENVLVVESDKADMDVESFYEGYLATIIVEAGQEAPVGSAIAYIAETQEEIAIAQQKAAGAVVPTPKVETPGAEVESTPVATLETPVVEVTNTNGNGRIVASPRAKKLAKELSVSLNTLRGTGPHGRIVAEDVEKAAGLAPTVVTPLVTVTTAPKPTATNASKAAAPAIAPGATVPLTTFQKALVQNMVAAMEAPTFRVGYTITTDELDKLYKQIKSKGVTMTALLAKAVALTLKKHPIVNASYSDA